MLSDLRWSAVRADRVLSGANKTAAECICNGPDAKVGKTASALSKTDVITPPHTILAHVRVVAELAHPKPKPVTRRGQFGA